MDDGPLAPDATHARVVLLTALPDGLAPDVPEAVRRALAATVLARGGGAVARRSAAAVWGFRLGMPGEDLARRPLEVLLPLDREPVRRSGIVCHVSDLPPEDVVLVDGVPVTVPARTLLDIARYEAAPVALATLDLALRTRALDPAELWERSEELAGRRGIRRARRLLDLADPGAESPAESWARLRLADAGLPRPETQVPVANSGPRPYRLDMAWRDALLAVEYDGREFHGAPPDVARDLRRRAFLAERGWTVLVVGAGEVLGRSRDLELTVAGLLGVTPLVRARTW